MIGADTMTGQTLGMLIMDFVIVFVVLLFARFLYGLAAGSNVMREMAGKNNHAVGISLAGATAGIGIMLSGVVTGTYASTFERELYAMLAYSAAGLFLMWLTRLIFDIVSLPSISARQEIAAGNAAIAIVDAGNMVATAIMVRAVMSWAEGSLGPGLIAVALGYVASQIILTLSTFYRVQLYRMRNQDRAGFHSVVQGGNTAVALRYVGFQVGIALAVTAASGIADYQIGIDPVTQGINWGLVSLALAVALAILALIAEKCVLWRLDLVEEVDRQRNIGVGLMGVAVYVAIGMMLIGLLG